MQSLCKKNHRRLLMLSAFINCASISARLGAFLIFNNALLALGEEELSIEKASKLIAKNTAALFFGLFASLVGQKKSDQLANQYTQEICSAAMNHLTNLPVSYYDDNPPGLMRDYIFSASYGMQKLFNSSFAFALDAIELIIISTLIGYFTQWFYSIMCFMALTFGLPTMYLINKKLIGAHEEKISNAYFTFIAALDDALDAWQTVRTFNMEYQTTLSLTRAYAQYMRHMNKHKTGTTKIMLGYTGIAFVTYLALIYGKTTAIENPNGFTELQNFLVLNNGFMMFMIPFLKLNTHVENIVDGRKKQQRLQKKVLDITPESRMQSRLSIFVMDDEKTGTESSHGPILEFRDVSFRYNEDKAVLSEVNLSIFPGQVVAIVGNSGSGKSTLAKIMMGSYNTSQDEKPNSINGAINFLGDPQSHFSIPELSNRISYAPEHTHIFDRNLHHNIFFGTNTQGLSSRCLQDFIKIMQLTDTCDKHRAHESIRGKLSKGEVQRIGIARALFKSKQNPGVALIILDEPTSGLDGATEKSIVQAVNQFMCDRKTTQSDAPCPALVVITHNLTTIALADKIYHLSQGQLELTNFEKMRALYASESFCSPSSMR